MDLFSPHEFVEQIIETMELPMQDELSRMDLLNGITGDLDSWQNLSEQFYFKDYSIYLMDNTMRAICPDSLLNNEQNIKVDFDAYGLTVYVRRGLIFMELAKKLGYDYYFIGKKFDQPAEGAIITVNDVSPTTRSWVILELIKMRFLAQDAVNSGRNLMWLMDGWFDKESFDKDIDNIIEALMSWCDGLDDRSEFYEFLYQTISNTVSSDSPHRFTALGDLYHTTLKLSVGQDVNYSRIAYLLLEQLFNNLGVSESEVESWFDFIDPISNNEIFNRSVAILTLLRRKAPDCSALKGLLNVFSGRLSNYSSNQVVDERSREGKSKRKLNTLDILLLIYFYFSWLSFLL